MTTKAEVESSLVEARDQQAWSVRYQIDGEDETKTCLIFADSANDAEEEFRKLNDIDYLQKHVDRNLEHMEQIDYEILGVFEWDEM